MINPLVSVVMSVYNSEKYLSEAIESILNQTYTNFEFIIINDGSTDSSLAIIQEYMKNDKRIISISRENKGLPYSLNEGIEKAKGKYIARMDADDISFPSRFEEQVKFMEENKDIGVCGTWAEVFGENVKTKLLKHSISHDELKVRLLFSVCFAHPTVMIRKSVLDENNLKYNIEYKNAQDYELWSRISKITRLANIPKVLLRYRVVNDGITVVANTQKKDLRYKLISEVFKNYLKKLNIENKEEENELHFILGLNDRIKNSNIDLKKIDKYVQKLLVANKKSKVFNQDKLYKFLAKKFFIASLFTLKCQKSNIIKLKISKLFICGLWESLKGKLA